MDEAEFGIDDISEEDNNRLKKKTMAKKKSKEAKTNLINFLNIFPLSII